MKPRSRSYSFSSSMGGDEESLMWAALERLPTYDRLNRGIFRPGDSEAAEVDVRKLKLQDKQAILDKLLPASEDDNEHLLLRLRERIDRVGIDVPKIEVKFENLNVQARIHVGTRALPTLTNFVSNILEGLLSALHLSPSKRTCLRILKDASGVIIPSRMTLLLGPPGSGKTTLLRALSGRLENGLNTSGRVTYNGHDLDDFVPQKTCGYISQQDLHYGEMTVRETLDFSLRCQGSGTKYEMVSELSRREKTLGVKPDPDIDIFMKATSTREQQANSLTSDYIMKLLELDICSDIIVGDAMRRGISGGQKKRLTTAEMLVGPAKAMFMDEISTGLDSSTTFHIIKCLRQFVHVMSGTMLISLLQPAPETFALFDDVVLLSEGQIVYQGPRDLALEFFESQGFKCPERKGAADFLQEVTSRRDQEQYWTGDKNSYSYVSVDEFSSAFRKFHVGEKLREHISRPYDKSNNHPAALAVQKYSMNMWELLKTCFAREVLLMRRNSFVYIFQLTQMVILATVAMTVFMRTKMKHDTVQGGIVYLGSLFFGLITIMFNGFAELAMVMLRLPVFYKQRDLLFFPAWTASLPMIFSRLPISLIETTIWVCLTYWVIGYAPEASRFFAQLLLYFSVNQMAQAFFRLIGAVGRTPVMANTFGSFFVLLMITLGGFVIGREEIHPWWIWGYWTSPLMYAQNALAVNEFGARRWNQPSINNSHTIGETVLIARGLFPQERWYWIGLGAVSGFAVLFNIGFVLAMTYLNPFTEPQAIRKEEDEDSKLLDNAEGVELSTKGDRSVRERGMVLPFQPLTLAFQHINYYVAMPAEMKQQGFAEDRLQLLQDISGVFRPGVLTALIGVSGAGKTTLMDVLAGRKTGGCIEGNINISGHPKNQETFARVSGYCEQMDVHSPNLTVEESLTFSAWLRLPRDINSSRRMTFVQEVLELVELTGLRSGLVGLPGVSGLSVEQRKRLTIAVELVANPSIIFMDEPTSGLDARAAAIVMRAVRNTVNTGRTVVCTIHQPSIDIFDAFDELLLMKRGGQLVYGGPLGKRSCAVIAYFESINGVPPISDGYNPATWMLEITSQASETHLGVDFAQIYKDSIQYRQTEQLIIEISTPVSDIPALSFPTKYSQSFLMQCTICLWKQHWSYWRNPYYNVVRMFFTTVSALLFGAIFWGLGSRREKQQDVFNLLGVLFSAVLFLGASNAMTVLPVVATERNVLYREKAAGMYSALPYAFAQVLIEVPYTLVQCILYGLITYSMIGFEWTPAKFSYFFFFSMAGFLYYTLYGMMAVALSPNEQVAAILTGFFFGIWNLFAGFLIPHKHIPIWWRWYYWLTPVAWTVQGLFSSQLGDVKTLLQIPDEPSIPVSQFLHDYFGFDRDFLGFVVAMHIVFIVGFAFVFAFCIKYLNFQRR